MKRRQLGLLLASLVLVGDAVPLGWWAMKLLAWIRDLQAHPSRDSLAALLERVGMVFLGVFGLALGAAAAGTAASAVAVSSGKKAGVLTGLVVAPTVAGVSAYMLFQGVADNPAAWYACVFANSFTALYLGFFLWRQTREETLSRN